MSAEPVSQKHQVHPLFIIAILIFIGTIAVFVALDATEDYRLQAHAAEHYLPAEAKILESKTESRRSGSKGGTSWHPFIRYRYEVNGKTYKAKRYSYAYTLQNSRAFVEAAVAAHPAGSTAIAYYDPENPKRAVLDNSPPDATYVLLFFAGFGSIFLFIAMVVLRGVLADRRRSL